MQSVNLFDRFFASGGRIHKRGPTTGEAFGGYNNQWLLAPRLKPTIICGHPLIAFLEARSSPRAYQDWPFPGWNHPTDNHIGIGIPAHPSDTV